MAVSDGGGCSGCGCAAPTVEGLAPIPTDAVVVAAATAAAADDDDEGCKKGGQKIGLGRKYVVT